MPLDGLAKRGSGFQRTVFLHRFWTVLFFVLCSQQLAEAQWWPFNTNFSTFTNQIEPGFRYPKIVSAARTQQRFPKIMHLPCDNVQMRSDKVPISVHQLRPGDIDVVAALGDSLIAGNGAMEEFAMGTLFEHRGVSWCAGCFTRPAQCPALKSIYFDAMVGKSCLYVMAIRFQTGTTELHLLPRYPA
ncbi:Hypothetical predicted protein [Cloeon dipterum]|uniref:Triacylglycerol lipase n=1 Tax=Cloeon dipterum TaxID=197152 RepID=A0A8S1BXF3_9INSE|nr:Hypothetical predicted protein [Cloeon dipterum]